MRAHLTLLLLAGWVALPACRSKPKKPVATLPPVPDVAAQSGRTSGRPKASPAAVPKPLAAPVPPKKPTPLATTPKPPKPAVAPPPPVVAKPAVPAVANPPAKPVAPKPDEAAAGKPRVPLVSTPPQVSPSAPLPKSPPARPADAEKSAERPPQTLKAARPVPSPAATALVPPAKPLVSLPPVPTVTSTVNPAMRPDGRGLGLGVAPAAPPADVVGPQPLRAPVAASGPPSTKPATAGLSLFGVAGVGARTPAADTRNLSLPTGSGVSGSGPLSTPLALQFGQGTNQPPRTNDGFKSITVDPLLPADKGATWREQQLAKQATEQKAREEEQRALKNALYRFLFKDGPSPAVPK